MSSGWIVKGTLLQAYMDPDISSIAVQPRKTSNCQYRELNCACMRSKYLLVNFALQYEPMNHSDYVQDNRRIFVKFKA